jgi:hypothetical protein
VDVTWACSSAFPSFGGTLTIPADNSIVLSGNAIGVCHLSLGLTAGATGVTISTYGRWI